MNNQRNLRDISVKLFFVTTVLFFSIIPSIPIFKETHAGEDAAKLHTEIKNISPQQAKELIDKEKEVFVLDVRTEEEYDKVHIKGANLIPIQDLEQNINRIPKDKKVIIHCATGKRSAKASEILKNKGLEELYNMEGGISKWQEEGFPVEKH